MTVVYLATRNLYDVLPAAYNSLLHYNPDAEVYLLIEDDTFPLRHPDNVRIMNVSGQNYINHSSPNYKSRYTYMASLKAALSKILWEYDKVLVLDVDTIVHENLTELWETDISRACYAAVTEPRMSAVKGYTYSNAGVMLLNLKLLRDTGLTDAILNALNTRYYDYPEQDTFNEFCGTSFIELPPRYNDTSICMRITPAPDRSAITHYAGLHKWDGVKEVRDWILASVTEPRVVVYAGNRRYYDNLKYAAMSLLEHSPVDRIYFLIEDDQFPEPLPEIIQCINVSGQTVFPLDGPNINWYYTYMTTLRAGLTKILPDEHRVLWLDPDTLVVDDISPVWNYDITGYAFAAVQETRNNDHKQKPYYNAGVMLMNLDFMRQTGLDDHIIAEINTKAYKHLEQDVLNVFCAGRILDLPSTYSESFVSSECKYPRIHHFLADEKSSLPRAQAPYTTCDWSDLTFAPPDCPVRADHMQRYDIINRFIQDRGFTSYLEIGVENGATFDRIQAPRRVSVDPDRTKNATCQMTSDEYFRTCKETFDIIFIDGLHTHDQVDRDIRNALAVLNPNGIIVLHDCLPASERMQEYHSESQYGYAWTGDVWKAFVSNRARQSYLMYTVDTDFGCGIIDTSRTERNKPDLPYNMDTMTYDQYVKHRDEWMHTTRYLLSRSETGVEAREGARTDK